MANRNADIKVAIVTPTVEAPAGTPVGSVMAGPVAVELPAPPAPPGETPPASFVPLDDPVDHRNIPAINVCQMHARVRWGAGVADLVVGVADGHDSVAQRLTRGVVLAVDVL